MFKWIWRITMVTTLPIQIIAVLIGNKILGYGFSLRSFKKYIWEGYNV
jgi:hypothetical protein